MVVLQRLGLGSERSKGLTTDARATVIPKKTERAEASMVSRGDSQCKAAEEMELAEALPVRPLKRAFYTKTKSQARTSKSIQVGSWLVGATLIEFSMDFL
jgi:hypothetical protein